MAASCSRTAAIRIADITDGTSNTALLCEHKGATCSTGSTNTICTEASGTTCYAYWASADAAAGSETSGNTVASDVCFTPLFGINGSGLGWTGAATVAPVPNVIYRVGYPGDISSQHEAGAQIALCGRLGPLRQPEHPGHRQRVPLCPSCTCSATGRTSKSSPCRNSKRQRDDLGLMFV